ncbi:MAG: hypothetical protein IH946_07025 [Bacteroidetes bacterium]|nr:hypothetical protein [Bacteroidota bacterium]
MTRKERFYHFIEHFKEHQPDPDTELVYTDPYQLLVAVILSAQCTDKRVNITTPILFQSFPTVRQLAKAEIPEIFEIIKSISYPNNISTFKQIRNSLILNRCRFFISFR